MLVLTRRLGESVAIGDDVVVTVLEVRGGQVRLGIVAPSEITVLRSEILDPVAEQNRQAASAQHPTMAPKVVTRPDPGA